MEELKGHTIGPEGSPKVESAAMKGAKQILLSAHPGDRWPVIAELFQLRTRDDFISIGQNPAHNERRYITRYETNSTWERLVPPCSEWVGGGLEFQILAKPNSQVFQAANKLSRFGRGFALGLLNVPPPNNSKVLFRFGMTWWDSTVKAEVPCPLARTPGCSLTPPMSGHTTGRWVERGGPKVT